MRTLHAGALTALHLALAAPFAAAQGHFTNFETPQTHPIEVVKLGPSSPPGQQQEFVLVCNTPDNSLQVWTADQTPLLRARVSVGLGPGTVRFLPTSDPKVGRAFVCNFDGDSISIVRLDVRSGTLLATLERTTRVGDEPADIAFSPNGAVGLVSLSTRGQILMVSPSDLSPFGAPARIEVGILDHDSTVTQPGPTSNFKVALKAPRGVAWLPADPASGNAERWMVLNLMGGQPKATAGPFVDLDLWHFPAPFSTGAQKYVGGLGTTNHAFAVNSNGTQIFVVGTRAQNQPNMGLASVRAAPTGFVQSWLSVVSVSSTGAMSVNPESGTGVPSVPPPPMFPSINLNRDYSVGGTALVENLGTPPVSQPTDVALLESGGAVSRIALTGYHSDDILVLTPANVSGGYVRQLLTFVPFDSSYSVVGPRGLAFNGSGSLLFVNGRLDNSLRVVDMSTVQQVGAVHLQDPTPAHIRTGRQFLYSTRFSVPTTSTTLPKPPGFVSCASCHIDGRTDGLLWDLSDAPPTALPVRPELNDTPIALPADGFPFTQFPLNKGPMITQTLQGLVNFETNEAWQILATNAPYHWRADKDDFTDFNEAFVNLQNMTAISGSGPTAKGVSDAQMVDYRRFIDTIRHPPNPEQPLERVPSGTLGNDPNVTNPTAAGGFSGGMMGRTLFHNFPMEGDLRSCVDCHSLPDGSSNTLVLSEDMNLGGPPAFQGIESAALRNLFAREGQTHQGTAASPPAVGGSGITPPQFVGSLITSNVGLLHNGDEQNIFSINTFVSATFFAFMPSVQPFVASGTIPPPLKLSECAEQMTGIVTYMREFDSGTASMVGFAFTLVSPGNSAVNHSILQDLEAQAKEANIGLGLQIHFGGSHLGMWYDPTIDVYRSATDFNSGLSRATLLSLPAAPGTTVVVQATPPGTERRWAHPTGSAPTISDTSKPPSAVVLEAMAPNTFHEGITDLNRNLSLTPVVGTTQWRIETLRSAVIGSATPPVFGIPASLRHEPPRRFRVSGKDIRPGAKLFLLMPDGTLDASGAPKFFDIGLEMRLFPTKYQRGQAPNNLTAVWETEVELDALQTMYFLCGGPFAPGVPDVVNQSLTLPPPPTSLNPQVFNQFVVVVQNEDGTTNIPPPTVPPPPPLVPVPLTVRDDRL
ncbi:MAG: YncE family protein [Planctomycetota bacterium]